MSDFMKELLKSTGNEYACNLSDETNPYNIDDYIDTGSLILNAMLSDGDIDKGLPMGRRIQFAGPSSTAKSLFTANIIKQFVDKHEGKCSVQFFESEGSSIAQMCKKLNIPSHLVNMLPVATVEEFRTQSTRLLNKILEYKEKDRLPTIMVLDSLGMLASSKEVNDAMSGSDKADMTRAKVIRSVMRCISLKLSLAKVPLIIVNHTYAEIGAFVPGQKIAGGGGTEYAPDVSLILGKAKEKTDGKQVGVNIRCLIQKSRYAKEGSIGRVKIFFNGGMYRWSSIMDWMVDNQIVFYDKASNMFFNTPEDMEANENGMPAVRFLKNVDQYISDEQYQAVRKLIMDEWALGGCDDEEEDEDIMEVDTSEIDLTEFSDYDLFWKAIEHRIWIKISKQKIKLDDGSIYKTKQVRDNPTPFMTDTVKQKIKIAMLSDNSDEFVADELEEE